jgi:hypothetical protein
MSRNRIKSFDLCIKERDSVSKQQTMSNETPPSGPRVPDHSAPPTGPLAEVRKHVLKIEGEVKVFVNKMPIDSLVDFSETGTHQVYLCCWTDGKNGKSCHVTFASANGVSGGSSPNSGIGKFKMDMDFWDNDPDKLKVQVSMRMRDEETNNRRTVPLCCSYARVDSMLQGSVDEFKMPNSFTNSMYATVSMRVSNASDFRNHSDSENNPDKILIKMRPSSLVHLPQFNDKLCKVSNGMQAFLVKNNTKLPPGGMQMVNGLSRSVPCQLLFLSLFLGTPAYVFV